MNKKQKKLTQPKTLKPKTLSKGGRRAFALFAVSTLLVGDTHHHRLRHRRR